MKTHTLDLRGLEKLHALLGRRANQIVWDLNAVYIICADGTTKIEATSGVLESPKTHAHEDIFPIRVCVNAGTRAFNEEGEPGLAYWVVATDEPITHIEIVRVAIRFPTDFPQFEPILPSSAEARAKDVVLIDCGVFIHTPVGVLPATPAGWCFFGFQHEPGGFTGPIVSLLGYAEAKEMLPECFELVPIENAIVMRRD